jgi:hypothetical protein
MLRVYRLLNEDYEIPPKILEINRRHTLIRNLAQMVAERPRDAVIEVAIEQMYENQLLLEGLHPNPPAMIPRLQKLLEAATSLETKGARTERSDDTHAVGTGSETEPGQSPSETAQAID